MEKISVQWINYWETFKNSLKEMRKTGDFCDVTLVCEDGDVLAHGFVLSTGSNVFSKMLKSTNTNQPNHNTNKPNHKVQLKGICKKELNWILDYIYHGHTFLDQSEIESFLKKGNLLGLVGFQKEITDYDISQTNESLLENFIKEESETPFIDTEIKEEHRNYLDNNKKYGRNDVKQDKGQNRDSNNDDRVILNAKVPENYKMKIPVYAEETSLIQDDMQWTILDVLIRNSLTKVSEGCFLCNFCKKEFFDMTFLKVHMEAHFEEFPGKLKPAMVKMQGDKNWKCLECGRISPKGHMREHIEVHVPGLQYECPKCSVNLTSKNNLRSHMVKACPKKEWVGCNLCDFSDKSQNVINTHITLTHNVSQYRGKKNEASFNPSSLYPGSSYKVWNCDQCEKYATSKEALTIHKYRYHSIASNQTESYNISPRIQSLLQDSEEDIHKSFSSTGIANDSEGSPLKCDMCNFITFYSDQLARHTATKHNKWQIMSSRA